MKLLNLNLKNFKGIKNFSFEPNGKDTNIYGDNATGKTTLADAFCWLLFGKDTKNQAVFEIKTLDHQGKTIAGIDHEVSITIEDDRKIELRKVYYEKWTKKRGSSAKELTGHTTDYFINGVPHMEKNYKEFIKSIIDEDKFRILTDPFYFSQTMSWQNRRALLLDVCGNIEDLEIIRSNPELSELTNILNGQSSDNHRKIISSKKTAINKQLDDIPIRIDESNRSIKEVKESEEILTSGIENLNKNIEIKKEKKLDLEQGGGITEKKNELKNLFFQKNSIIEKHKFDIDKLIIEAKNILLEHENQYKNTINKITQLEKQFNINDEIIDNINEKITKLRQEWHETNIKTFNPENLNICPIHKIVCPLPEEHTKNIENAQEIFNKEKSVSLENIQYRGKGLKAESDKLKADNEKIKTEIESLSKEKEAINKKANDTENEIEEVLKRKYNDYENNHEFKELIIKIKILQEVVTKLQNGDNRQAIEILSKEISDANSLLSDLKGKLLQIKHNQSIRERIEELKKQEKTLAAEYEKIEHEFYILDLFERTKSRMLEENINNRFRLTNFKLFNPLINGGLEPCCEVTDKQGVPYSTGLNRGACINIGLDVINTLSDYYGFQAPIFIDNAEAISDLLKTRGQQIRLYVLAGQETLKILTA